ncbi:unnamed protein product [Adineta steineri]|uniref:Uncharacterized protein n=1 Tax=Adineta steineri TaxID=433720 RepID=A0A815LKK8_9BILA|nr:unnamed protein product [Adineta steineri]
MSHDPNTFNNPSAPQGDYQSYPLEPPDAYQSYPPPQAGGSSSQAAESPPQASMFFFLNSMINSIIYTNKGGGYGQNQMLYKN